MTYRELIQKIIGCVEDLDKEVNIEILIMDTFRIVRKSRKCPISYFAFSRNTICVEEEELKESKESIFH